MRRAAQVLLLAAAGALVAPAVAEACWSGYYCESYGYDAGGSVYGYSRTYGYYGDFFYVETSLTDPQWSTVSDWAQGQFEVTAEVSVEAGSSGDYYISGNHYYWGSEPWWGWHWDGASSYDVYVLPPPPPPQITVCPLPSPAWGAGTHWAVIGGSGFWGNTPLIWWSGNGGVNFLQWSYATVTSDSQIDLGVSLAPVTSEGSITLGVGTAACMFAVQPPPPPPPTVSITSASIPDDRITIALAPQGSSGILTVKVWGGAYEHRLYQGTRSGGTHNISFDIPNLPGVREYSGVEAVWVVGTQTGSAIYSYHFKVLGDYDNTRYNTPTESFCSGSPMDIFRVSGTCGAAENCDFATVQGKSGWWAEVDENGSGVSETPSIGVVSREWSCAGPQPKVRSVPAPCPQCSGQTLSVGSTVARNVSNSNLPCGATLYVHQVGTVTVVDAGGGLALNQLDHYAGFGGCNRVGGSIGVRKVIRLF
jgi:hypothetical protein